VSGVPVKHNKRAFVMSYKKTNQRAGGRELWRHDIIVFDVIWSVFCDTKPGQAKLKLIFSIIVAETAKIGRGNAASGNPRRQYL
jgi:hypothetical protein